MDYMFYKCISLEKLNFSNFKSDKIINMKYMFFACSSLEELNLCNFSFNNKSNVRSMFFGCSDELKMKIKDQYKNIKKEAFI